MSYIWIFICMYLLCSYIVLAFDNRFQDLIIEALAGTQNLYNRIISIIEAIFLVFTMINYFTNSLPIALTSLLISFWILIWTMFVSLETLYKKKSYQKLYINISIIMYTFLLGSLAIELIYGK